MGKYCPTCQGSHNLDSQFKNCKDRKKKEKMRSKRARQNQLFGQGENVIKQQNLEIRCNSLYQAIKTEQIQNTKLKISFQQKKKKQNLENENNQETCQTNTQELVQQLKSKILQLQQKMILLVGQSQKEQMKSNNLIEKAKVTHRIQLNQLQDEMQRLDYINTRLSEKSKLKQKQIQILKQKQIQILKQKQTQIQEEVQISVIKQSIYVCNECKKIKLVNSKHQDIQSNDKVPLKLQNIKLKQHIIKLKERIRTQQLYIEKKVKQLRNSHIQHLKAQINVGELNEKIQMLQKQISRLGLYPEHQTEYTASGRVIDMDSVYCQIAKYSLGPICGWYTTLGTDRYRPKNQPSLDDKCLLCNHPPVFVKQTYCQQIRQQLKKRGIIFQYASSNRAIAAKQIRVDTQKVIQTLQYLKIQVWLHLIGFKKKYFSRSLSQIQIIKNPDNRIDYALTDMHRNLKLYKKKEEGQEIMYTLCGTFWGGFSKKCNNIKYKLYAILFHHLKNRFYIYPYFYNVDNKSLKKRIDYLEDVTDYLQEWITFGTRYQISVYGEDVMNFGLVSKILQEFKKQVDLLEVIQIKKQIYLARIKRTFKMIQTIDLDKEDNCKTVYAYLLNMFGWSTLDISRQLNKIKVGDRYDFESFWLQNHIQIQEVLKQNRRNQKYNKRNELGRFFTPPGLQMLQQYQEIIS